MDNIKNEIKRLVKELRDNGVGENEIRELFEVKKPLSRLLVTHDKRIVLPDYNNLEIKMEPIHKAVYLLFLNHPEGIRFKELPDYREELAGIYRAMKLSTQARKKVERSIIDVTDPLKSSMSEKCVRIRYAFQKAVGAETAKNYYINGGRGEYKRIELNRELVIYEQKESPPE